MSLFITSNILPINMLYVETVSLLMYDVSHLSVPSNISDLFTKHLAIKNCEKTFLKNI